MERKKAGMMLGLFLALGMVLSLLAAVASRVHGRYMGCELAMAVGNEDLPRLKHLLERGADPNTDVFQFGSDSACSGQVWFAEGREATMPALLYKLHPMRTSNDIGNTTVARLLLNAGANVNATDWRGDTPLIVAARAGNIEIVKLLLAKKAKVQATNNFRQTALTESRKYKHSEILALLDHQNQTP